MRQRIPILTLTLVALSVVVYALPGAARLVYAIRDANLAGEWWRIVTGHWVHFSAQHFLYDTAAFGIAGWMIESRQCKNFGWLCAIEVVAISGSMLLFEPRLQICGGLSGLATAAVVFLALNGLEVRGAWRWICGAALVLCAAKTFRRSNCWPLSFSAHASLHPPCPPITSPGALTPLLVVYLVHANCVSESVFPSGSLNHAINPPDGAYPHP